MRGTTSRLVENRTTHRGDFVQGASDSVYLAKVAAVEGKDVATGSGTTYAYVPGIVGGSVAIINTSTNALVSSISGTTNPYAIAATPNGSELYLTESGTNTVSVISTASNAVTSTIVVGVYPHGVAITPDGTKAYVANTGPNTGPGGSETVSVIDIASGAVRPVTVASGRVRHVLTLDQPHGVAVSPDGSHVYVTDSENDAVVVLDGASLRVRGVIPVGNTPWNTAFSADGTAAYVTNANSDSVSVIDTATRRVSATIALGAGNHIPTAIALNGSTLWVACNASSTVPLIDTASGAVGATIDIGLGFVPTAIAFA
jgi:phospholipase C